jgi:hypothetical protein
MPSQRLSAASHLFTVRLWREDLGDDQVEWRGQVTHVLSGEAHWFRGWTELVAHLATAVLQREQVDEVQTPAANTT